MQTRSDTTPAIDERLRMLGAIVWLCGQSPMHAQMQIDEISELFLAPLAGGQLRIWGRAAQPVGVATWAWLSAEAEAEYLETGKVPQGAWSSGERLWFVDVIAPFGDAPGIARDLRQIIPTGAVARSARWTDTGALRRIGRFTRGPATTPAVH
ncbi:ACP:hemolysin acyltransferase (hemolysin-activating protein) [Poseidonocella pacifica]|uniref:RTX toxin-activating lysine-acyltransferase n=1 Tax=Poseidonocella pacifica TaxID=871651 RepID=A0A1I0XD64_9RHOB|nr:toxin-activating lysine-acyltransferase [Poseidonocella pacifica]SFA98366.1 ACP:hemolysin acyltransferase (hemolysin-activating protein) [Poseidonocella pacifica]